MKTDSGKFCSDSRTVFPLCDLSLRRTVGNKILFFIECCASLSSFKLQYTLISEYVGFLFRYFLFLFV